MPTAAQPLLARPPLNTTTPTSGSRAGGTYETRIARDKIVPNFPLRPVQVGYLYKYHLMTTMLRVRARSTQAPPPISHFNPWPQKSEGLVPVVDPAPSDPTRGKGATSESALVGGASCTASCVCVPPGTAAPDLVGWLSNAPGSGYGRGRRSGVFVGRRL